MYFWSPYPFIRFSTAFILGIVLFDFFPRLWEVDIPILFALPLLFGSSVLGAHRFGFYRLRVANGLLAVLCLAFLGGYLTKSMYHLHPKTHYQNLNSSISGFSGIINSTFTDRGHHYRYELELRSVVGDSAQEVIGKILLYVRKDSVNTSPLRYGDLILVKGAFYEVDKPGNPEAFNYKQYLERQNIYSQAYARVEDVKIIGNNPPLKLLSFAFLIKQKALTIIDQYIPEENENAISKALLLGVKDFLGDDIKQSYATAGAMHVLAVSGLHVGIVYLILKLLLGNLRERGFLGKASFTLISIILIWFYALLTGFSPSVLRAATMFSIMTLGHAFAKDSNIYNTLGVAAFVLLALEPYHIYSAGFQLSFAAVFGIVYLQPRIYGLLAFRHLITDKLWEVSCVSIAAQIATFPLSIYYFHQFPTWFFLSNLVVIPAAFLALIFGILLLSLAQICAWLGELIGRVLYFLILTVNNAVEAIEQLPYSLIDWIYLDTWTLLAIYGLILTLFGAVHYSSFKTFTLSFCFGLAMLFGRIESHIQQAKTHQLIFYQNRNQLALDHIKGLQACLHVDDASPDQLTSLSRSVDPYRLAHHLPSTKNSQSLGKRGFKFEGVFRYGFVGGQRILVIDSTTFHLSIHEIITTDILIINNEAIKSMKWLKHHFNYHHLIISNQNSRSYSRRMKEQGERLGVTVHSLKEDGALIIPLKIKKSGH